MAKAKHNPEKTETAVVEEATITLTLSLAEAEYLESLVGLTVGHHGWHIYDTLNDAVNEAVGRNRHHTEFEDDGKAVGSLAPVHEHL